MTRSTNPFVKQAKGIFLLVVAALAGGISGVMFAYSPDSAEVATLDDYAPNTITRVYAAGGEEIGVDPVGVALVAGMAYAVFTLAVKGPLRAAAGTARRRCRRPRRRLVVVEDVRPVGTATVLPATSPMAAREHHHATALLRGR